jgi:N-acetylglutamate synthase-like GNAT family acetyltransferase
LVEALLQEAEGEVYLATVIPGFFEKMGFQEAPVRPKGLVKSPEWCGDCPKERCRVMKRDSQ